MLHGLARQRTIYLVNVDPPSGENTPAHVTTLVSLTTDGGFLQAAPPGGGPGTPHRTIEWVGDSMMGTNVRRWDMGGQTSRACLGVESDYTLTSNAQVCATLGANCSTIAVGGHGMCVATAHALITPSRHCIDCSTQCAH